MANISKVKLDAYAEKKEITFSTGATAGDFIAFDGKDEKTVILIQNASTTTDGTLTLKAGDGIQGVADVELAIPRNKYFAVAIESGMFKILSGANKGKVKVVPSATDIKYSVVELV